MMKRSSDDIFAETLTKRKSQNKYDDEWERFIKYSELPDIVQVGDITEEIVAQYLDFLHAELKLAPTTIWSCFSKINTKYQDIGGGKLQDKFPRLVNLMKRYQSGYIPKRADTFSFDQVKLFLETANDEGKYLLYKAVVCMALYGGLRCADLVSIQNEDITVNDTTGVWVRYGVSKISGSFHKTNTFVIPKPHDAYVTNYLNATNRHGRVFKNYNKGFTSQPMGVRTLGLVPAAVAKFLGVNGNYTGHCFRRSCATILAENGATSTQLKTLMNWKGDNTALNYIDNTQSSRVQMSSLISGSSTEYMQASAKPHGDRVQNAPHFENTSFTNCVFNFGNF